MRDENRFGDEIIDMGVSGPNMGYEARDLEDCAARREKPGPQAEGRWQARTAPPGMQSAPHVHSARIH